VDKCYKVHGYPPGFKSNKPKLQFSSTHQVQGNEFDSETKNSQNIQPIQAPSLSFTQTQSEQLLALLKPSNLDNQDQIFLAMSSLHTLSSNSFDLSHSVFSVVHFHSFQVASNHSHDHNPWC
jgi:hypothetical protein